MNVHRYVRAALCSYVRCRARTMSLRRLGWLIASVLLLLTMVETTRAQFIAKLTASDGEPGDFFGGLTRHGGSGVGSLYGDTAVIGAPTSDLGAVYVFERNEGGPNTWGQITKIAAPDDLGGSGFGYSADIYEDMIVAGAPADEWAESGIGAAFLFARDEGGADNWGEVAKLMASDGQMGDAFGANSAIVGDTTIVGAYGDTRGGLYVFGSDLAGDGKWQELVKISTQGEYFGASIAITGDTAIVGWPFNHEPGVRAGAALIFERHLGGTALWGEVLKFTPSDIEAGDWFGTDVDVSGDTAIIGAPQMRTKADPAGAGAAYILERQTGGGNNWQEVAKLTASDGEAGDSFGEAVAVFGDIAVVGATKDRNHTGTATGPGSAYVFARNAGGPNNWGEILELSAPDPQENDHFGKDVDVFGDTILVVAPGHNDDAGAAYIFEVPQNGHVLMPGDADQNLEFNQLDLVRVLIADKYMTGEPATWGEGDWDGAPGGQVGNPPAGDGVFNQFDILAAMASGEYLAGPNPAILEGGQQDDDQTSVIYNAVTGEMGVDAPAATELTSINIDSAAAIFTGDAAQNLGGSFDNDADNNIFKATFGSSFGSLSFGNVAQPGLSREFVLNDLTVVGSLNGGGDLGSVDLVYVPEPSTLILFGLGLFGILTLRRSRLP